jgi:hypothetical protein
MIGYKNSTDHISHVVLATFVLQNIFNKIIKIEVKKMNKFSDRINLLIKANMYES